VEEEILYEGLRDLPLIVNCLLGADVSYRVLYLRESAFCQIIISPVALYIPNLNSFTSENISKHANIFNRSLMLLLLLCEMIKMEVFVLLTNASIINYHWRLQQKNGRKIPSKNHYKQ